MISSISVRPLLCGSAALPASLKELLDWACRYGTARNTATITAVNSLRSLEFSFSQRISVMRLGKYPCVLIDGTRSRELYGVPEITERHRHRFEFNNDYRAEMQAGGLNLAGLSPSGNLVEIVELPEHPWFVGVQFHPEFKSRPNRPHPLFYGFVKAAVEKQG